VTSNDSVLVVGPSWVGDMVMAQSLFIDLHARRPGVAVDVVAPRWSMPLLARMPEVRRGIELDTAHGEIGWRKRRALGRRLRANDYRQAIVLPRSIKAALVPFFARIPRRTGFRGEYRFGLLNDVRPFDGRILDQTVKRFLALGADPGREPPAVIPEPRLVSDAAKYAALARQFEIPAGLPVIAFMPGAEYGPAKRWPAEHFGELAKRLVARGCVVVVLGSTKEVEIGDVIAAKAASAHVLNLCGKTALVDALDILAAADVALTNDSGLLHVAAALDRPVVALYGSSTPDFTPPLTRKATVIYERIDCSPCFERECPLQHFACMFAITVDKVEHAVVAELTRH
jgi:heptosyltransferase-2